MHVIKLNKAQQEAVDHIYGPMLVLAGPGTGKTQLLSARIANILQKTDASAQNILCLTFTEAAAQNMRERLASIIKDDAYDVHINTYHGFGSDIIRSYPEFFEDIDLETGKDSRIERPIDDLQRIQIISELINKLPFSSPLIGARHYVKNVSSTISEIKRGLYTPESLRDVATDNLKQVRELSPKIAAHIGIIKSFPGTAEKSLELFAGVEEILQGHKGLAAVAHDNLEQAMAEAVETNKSKPLTAWKNAWLTKDDSNQFRFTDEFKHLRIIELANVYEKYQQALDSKQLYDFDDMILRTINALQTKDELRFNLQEKYQFVLLDEFQDTNAAQFELVKQLANNPVNEGKPNIFAVGDDDQAIYAFQGARSSNMLGFINAFVDVKVINLVENYRSHPDIIHTAHNVAAQIESRLHHDIEGVEKTLISSAQNLPENATIQRHEFSSQASEYAWVAQHIQELINAGTSPDEIAVLAPKHRLLEHIVPFLVSHNTPLSYEKREDILHTPIMRAFRSMIELVLAAHDGDEMKMNELMPRVLSLDFYQIPVADIWKVNWAYKPRDEDCSWVEIALDTESLAPHVMFFLSLGLKSAAEPLEYMLDYLTGSTALVIDAETTYTSPLKEFYFSGRQSDPLRFYEALANLSTIREHIRAQQAGTENLLGLQDFLDFVSAHEAAEVPLINTHPIAQAQKSVQLMTVYKAKGLEFEHVFLLSVHDDIWGKKARTNANKISLPANLQHVRYQGSSEDELRRILFVAITRAKHGLYLTSYANKDSGKATEPVKYLLEFDDGESRKTTVLPATQQTLQITSYSPADTMQHIDTMWHSRHVKLDTNLKSLLKPRLEKYQMSPTHLNAFIDMEYGGPENFLLNTLLRFPSAPGEDGEFGNAVHATLERVQGEGFKVKGSIDIKQALKEFDKALSRRYIPAERMDDLRNRGHYVLKNYLDARKEMFNVTAKPEVDFRKEGVMLGEAHLSGKIDRLEIDKINKTVNIVDFKTGKPHDKWERSIKLLKYKQQLYFYKFLIEGSHTWSGYTVKEARLEFVEPDADGTILPPLQISFDDNDKSSQALTTERETKDLIQAVWKKMKALDLPETATYSNDFKGSTDFIQDIVDN